MIPHNVNQSKQLTAHIHRYRSKEGGHC